MKKIFTLAIMAVVLTGLGGREAAAAPPQISFVEPPTPVDGATIEGTSVEIEVSIIEADLADVTFNWDGTDYILYDDYSIDDPDCLVLMFNFDNVAALGEDYTADGLVKDVSGAGNDGYLSDTPGVPVWVAGMYGGAFDFTGDGSTSGQSILVLHDDSLNPGSGDFAIAVWILTRDDYDGDILRKGSSTTASTNYKLEHAPGGDTDTIALNFTTDGTGATVTSAAAYNDEQWHFVVAQRNGSQAELWIDGVLAGTASVTGSISNTANLAVGSKDTQNDDFLNSTLDEVRIYMRSFSQDEIKELYYSNLNKYDLDKWTLYVNQSDLFDGTYTYQASASNVGETGSTEQRSVTIDAMTPVTLVPAGASWKYLDDGSDQGTAWSEPLFDDNAWEEGPAQLGYGGNGEVTTISYGPDSGNKYPCYYFRHTFNVADASQVGSLKLRLVRDDGAVVYLNGVEIVRDNMPGGDIDYLTLASNVVGGSDETTWWEFDVAPAGLVDGTNLLAVEIHQINYTSSDISMNLELAETEHMRKGPYMFYTGLNTEMKILWQVDVPQACTLEWGTDPADLSESVTTTEFGSDHQHEYTIGGDVEKPPLVPGTKYYYKVTDAYNGAYTGSFTTAPVVNIDDLKFLVFGDTRAPAVGQVPYAYDDVCGAMNTFLAANPDYQTLTVLVGDWIYNDTEDDWQNMFFNRSLSNALELHANMPINGCIGNHEMNVGGGAVYEKYWPYPYETGGRYWSFDSGPAHFAIVDQYVAYSPGSTQYIWLENDLANSTALWNFVVIHEPGYTAGGGNAGVRDYIHPLCVTYGVDFVLSGHDHYYSRSVVDGVQHITTGGGGAPLKGVVPQSHTVAAESVYQFCEIEIQGDTLYFSALRLDHSDIDSFSITKPWPEASSPSPADGEQNVALDVVLSWTAGAGAVNHDVYFGTSDPPAFVQNQAGTSYGPLSLSSGTTYYWRIDEFDGTTTYAGNVWSFTTIDNPQQASDPSPANGATDVAIEADLDWTAGAGAVSHNVYFGTEVASLPLVSAAQTDPSYEPGTLTNNTTYYWRIDELDGSGSLIAAGLTWSFETAAAPGQASGPSPGDAATDVALDADLNWTAGSDTTSHDVYFGINPTPGEAESQGNQAGTTFDPVSMDYVTTYYWRIDEVGPGGTTTGAVWSFTTVPPPPPGQATNPSPADGAVDVAVDADLSWDAGEGAVSHDVYFGTNAAPGVDEFKGNQTTIGYDPGTLEEGIPYYWRIDEYNSNNDKTTGVVWSFTTVLPEPPEKATPSAPINPDWTAVDVLDVGVGVILAWLSGERAASHDVYFGVGFDLVNNADNASPEFKGNILQQDGMVIPDGTYFTWDPTTGDEDLPYDSPYWWRIDEINPGGTTKGDIWNFTTESDTSPPIFTYSPQVVPGSVTAHEATINWTTNELSDSLVDYGLSTSYGESVYDGDEVTSHSVTLTGLEPATTYYYRATSTDQAEPGNSTSEVGLPFTTEENTPPVAVNDSATTNEATPVVIDVLVNDSDFDGDTLTVESVTYDPAKATVETDGDTVTYTPILAAPYIDTFSYTVNDGYGGTDTATVTVEVSEPYVDYTADGEIPAYGTVTGSYTDTQAKDSSYEVIEEVPVRPNSNAHSILEHKWLFDVPGSGPLSFHINAYRDDYDEADNFAFAYSTDDVSYTEMLTVTKTADDGMYQTYTLPDSVSGTVYILVSDTNHDRKELVLGQVHVDHMFIRREIIVAPPDQASNPSPADAALDVAVSADLSWTAGAGAESHDVWFGTDAGSLSLVSEGQSGTTFDPGTLATSTPYYWRIDEENSFGTTTGEVWSFTTGDGSVADVYVESIDMAVVLGKKFYATATIAITPGLDGATVVGDWYFKGALRTSGATAVTNASGIAEFISFETPAKSGDTFMFVVTDVVFSGYIYDPGQGVTSGSIAVP
jgi:hypothetical protein